MLKKILSLLIVIIFIFSAGVFACDDIFINYPKSHIVGRVMDFSVNVANDTVFAFIGQKNITDIVIDAERIPESQLANWTIKYGYWGRGVFGTPIVDDAMNTEGLSISGLYLEGITNYPVYNNNDKRPVLGIFDIGSYLLGQCKNTNEAVALIRKTQIVRSAIKFQHGIFVADIPVHLSIRDASGISAVIEFENGLVQIYENAGNVLTNEPSYPDQLLNAKKYDNILPATTEGLLTGIPGGSDSKDRFARAYIYLRSLNQPSTHLEALYQADRVINTLIRPYLGYRGGGSNSCSIWYVIKDLDEKVVYEKNLLFYQDFSTISVSDISNGFHKVDLKAIDFNVIPKEYADFVVKPTDPKKILKIIKASEIPGF